MSITVTRRGQITLPKPVRERLGLTPGCAVAFYLDKDGHVVMIRADEGAAPPSNRFARLRGVAGAGPSTDQIMRLTRGTG